MSDNSPAGATRSSPRRPKQTTPNREQNLTADKHQISEFEEGDQKDELVAKTNGVDIDSAKQTKNGNGNLNNTVAEGHHGELADNERVCTPKEQTLPTTPPDSANMRVSTRKRRTATNSFADDSQSSSAGPPPSKRSTPKSPRTSFGSTKGKKRQPTKERVPQHINFDDPDDPYNFAANANVHPEPLKNISIERSSFGDYKFTKSSPSSTDRYANVERIAAGRNPQLLVNASKSSPLTPGQPTSLSMLNQSSSLHLELTLSSAGGNTPKLASTSRASRKKLRASTEDEDENAVDEFQMDEDDEAEAQPNTSKRKSKASFYEKSSKSTPTSRNVSQKATDRSLSSSIKSPKKPDAQYYIVPKLSALEQFVVDHPKDADHFLEPGARVLALWGKEYYAANICGREALSRYYVHFVEDNLDRILPPSGVIPISFLHSGTRISFIETDGNEEVGKVSEVVAQPVIDNEEDPQGWVDGVFELRELDEDLNPSEEIKKVAWSKLYLNNEQGHQIIQGKTFNPVVRIDQENIVNESRATRRSRSMRNSTESPLKTPDLVVSQRSARKTPKSETKLAASSSSQRSQRGRRSKNQSVHGQIEEEKSGGEEERKADDGEEEKTVSDVSKTSTVNSPLKSIEEKKDVEHVSPNTTEENEKKMELDESIDTVNTTTDEAGTPMGYNGDLGAGIPSKVMVGTTTPDQEDGVKEMRTATAVNQSQHHASPEKTKTPVKEVASPGAEVDDEPMDDEEEHVDEKTIFKGLKFVLTSANRPNKVSNFNKREYRTKIEERGGQVVEDFSALQPNDVAYLIADTYYRTHKYLCALSMSIPCVSFKWVQECVERKQLVNHEAHLLPSGESTVEPGQICQWKPLKGELFKGKRILVYCKYVSEDPKIVPFDAIWAPLLRNLGAEIVGIGPNEPFSANRREATLEEKLVFCAKNEGIDVLLAENDCERELAENMQKMGTMTVSSEWVIQAIVTGELPDPNSSEKFNYEYV